MKKIAPPFYVMILAASSALSQAQVPAEVPVATSVISPALAAQYVHPHQLIDVGGGRKMNLFCMGTGSHTVIFDAGGGDWSVIWALVQPGVAAHARACSYDRAGMGYSDPSDYPRSPLYIVEDLHALIRAAKIDTPVILVGHSLGGFNMKLYAALYPKDVAGLVLVDPAEDREVTRTHNALLAKFGATATAEQELQYLTQNDAEECATAARVHDLDPKSDLYKKCTDPAWKQLGPVIAAERQKIQVKRAYQVAQASEYAHDIYTDTGSDGVYSNLFSKHALGDKPLIVLTQSMYNPKNPMAPLNKFAWDLLHEQTAALSTRGINRFVPESSHNIQMDHPQVVIDAINEVLHDIAPK
jgi:pimeloyl-ACP methyl ester carboxylesterase